MKKAVSVLVAIGIILISLALCLSVGAVSSGKIGGCSW